MINRIIIDPMRRAKGHPAVCAPHKHHIRSGVEAGWLYTRHHVNVIVSRTTRTVHRQEQLPFKSPWIYGVAEIQAAAQVDLGDLVKRWRNARVLCVA
jgi:hypothetical protein